MPDEAVHGSRAELLTFLQTVYWETPPEAFVAGLFEDDVGSPPTDVNEPLDRGFERLGTFYEENHDRSPDDVWEEVAAEHARLFLGGNPQVPARETAYRDGVAADADPMTEVRSSYEAAGWSPPESPRADDFVAVELAYLAHLVDRQREGDAEAYEREREFVDEHLSRWIEPFTRDLAAETESGLYRATADLLRGVVTFEDALVTTVLVD